MKINGHLSLPGDKSISHRAIMLASLSEGKSILENISTGKDVESTAVCLKKCGIRIEKNPGEMSVSGGTLQHAVSPLNCGNSGTTARMLTGLLVGQKISAAVTGDPSLSKRPMGRIILPLTKMGADIMSMDQFLPIHITPSPLHGILYSIPVASAQVKSAILFAGLGADGRTVVTEPVGTRDHTENMFAHLGLPIQFKDTSISVNKVNKPIEPFHFTIPGDPSSAAFFAAAAALIPDSEIVFTNLLLNKTRTGFFDILHQMGGDVELTPQKDVMGESVGEAVVRYHPLHAVKITKEIIPAVIDELPLISILASQAEGVTSISGAEELRLKESDRIHAVRTNLENMGVKVTELTDGLTISGPSRLKGVPVFTFNDHRIAMAFSIAGLITDSPVTLDYPDCTAISYPSFKKDLQSILN